MYKLAIVGLGPAGIFALALLPPEVQRQTIVFEPAAIGGALATDYGAVVANIPKSVIVAAFKEVPAWSSATFSYLEKYKDDECPVLNDVVRQLRELIAPDCARAVFHSTSVQEYLQTAHGKWRIKTSSGLFEAQKLIIATGAAPRTLDLPKPVIPLRTVLNPLAIQDFVSAEDKIVVFGTAHSGTLALRNLREAGVKTLTGLYKGAKPFMYARDGFSEGIKQESATIADDLVAHKWASLISLDDFSAAHRAVSEATAVVYAIGFERPAPTYLAADGVEKPLFAAPNVWGFGIGSPSFYTAPDGKSYPDVGFGGFIGAIKSALPSVLTFEP